jgi:hypothetical protein
VLIVPSGDRFELALKRAPKTASPMVVSDFAYE